MGTATLTTLTPVHIGSGQTLKKNFDFIQEGNRIGFLDLDKIVQLIGTDSIPQLAAAIEKGESLEKFLRVGRGFKNFKLEDVSHRVANAINLSVTTTELKEHYHTSLKGVCIPGSSLKGSIKTALFELLATRSFLQQQPVDNFGKIRFNRKSNQEEREYKDDKIEKMLFGNNANEKSTRFIKIGDCSFGEDQELLVAEVGIYNLGGKGWNFKPERLLVETIPEGAKTNFEFKLEADWLVKNRNHYPQKWASINTAFISEGLPILCTKLNNYIERQIDFELKDLKEYEFGGEEPGLVMLEKLESIKQHVREIKNANDLSCILRIGGHNGWNFTTGAWMKKAEAQDKLSDDDYYDLRLSIQKKDRQNIGLWPKTRKITIRGIPLGFVKVTFKQQ